MDFGNNWTLHLIIWWLVLFSVERTSGFSKVRGVNLGGWLVVEGWIKPSLFDGIPNNDLLDGTQVQFKSTTLQKYVSADNGGGGNVTVDRDLASSWETFRLWRISESEFQFRCFGGQFLTSSGDTNLISGSAEAPDAAEIFSIERNQTRIHIKLLAGNYIQATTENQLTADYQGEPGWDDNSATFEMIISANNLHGDYQLANGYGPDKARHVLMIIENLLKSCTPASLEGKPTSHVPYVIVFVTRLINVILGIMILSRRNTGLPSLQWKILGLSHHGINTVRIPVGWWIAQDPKPPAPFVGGTLAALDAAFSWAQMFDLRCIIDLHAAPGSQNGMSAGWTSSPDNIQKSLDVIEFLAARYANHPALLGIELLNEPSTSAVPLDVLVSYYTKGYNVVRKYSSKAYVIICQRIGNADPMELYQANIGSSNLVVDLHYYNLFDSFFNNLSAVNNIQFIYKSRDPQVQALNNANGPLLFIGEWTNEWNGTNGSLLEYQEYGRAQLDVYNAASFGRSYWTLKCAEVHWDFEWCQEQLSHIRFLSRYAYFKTVHISCTVSCVFLLTALDMSREK